MSASITDKEQRELVENASPSPSAEDGNVTHRNEKGEITHIDPALARRVHDPEVRKAIERKLLWKLDTRLMPTVIVIFILNYIDRNNVSTARLSGLQQDLGLSDVQYESCIAILYSSYITFQTPSNLFLNYVSKPSLYIPIMVILWGLVSLLTGVTKNFTGIALCRVAIGIPEAAFYPGTIYLLSRWYTKKELAFRSAWLYCGLIISNAFGALMAAGILSNLEGKLGVRGWRWLFYIEGAITMAVGFLAMLSLPDYPYNTWWLTTEEKIVAQQRLSEDAGEADQDSSGDTAWKGFKMAITDPKVLVFMFMTFVQLLGLSFVNFFPTLTQTLGYSTTVTLLLCAPPWAYAFIVCITNARHSDWVQERFWHITWPWMGVLVGYIIAMSTQVTAARYIALFLMAAGYAGFALTLVWVSNSFPRPPVKRAAAIGLVNGFGNLGNLVGSYVWDAKFSPIYRQSMGVGVVGLVLAIGCACIIRILLKRMNKNLERLEEVMDAAGVDTADRDMDRLRATAEIEGIALDEAAAMKIGFRYLL
ncbi:MFS general substrate transporter [Calocera viscosa TUFC12733]|uniref:MFS general substrate transporter n=1 Tax=Calocera viscosa (strain TUFC12733) TaxID=1330018 RepID=A0A167GAJ7_CALVF|nr:MFS general substrate transporter [Calocera viscosa TUFC12733]